jgi:hypothetical protein
MLDTKVKAVVSRIKKLETQMAKLEGRKRTAPAKAKPKRTTKSRKR